MSIVEQKNVEMAAEDASAGAAGPSEERDEPCQRDLNAARAMFHLVYPFMRYAQ